MSEVIRLIFDGPPSPTAGRFIEAENEAGASIRVGEWKEHRNIEGWWELVIDLDRMRSAAAPETAAALEKAREDIAELVDALKYAANELKITAGYFRCEGMRGTAEGVEYAKERLRATLAKHARTENTESAEVPPA